MSFGPLCPYCGRESALDTKYRFYPHRPDLADKHIWICKPCGAWVGCHKGTTRALGRLANAELRALKCQAHRAFDPMWKSGHDKDVKRATAYAWLARQLGIPGRECHIGHFDPEMCRRVIDVCSAHQQEAAE